MFTGAYKKKRMANQAISSNPIVASSDELKTQGSEFIIKRLN